MEIRQALASVGSLMEVSDWLTAADTISLVECLHSKAHSAREIDCLASTPQQLEDLRGQLQKNLMVALQSAAEFKGMEELTLSCGRELEVRLQPLSAQLASHVHATGCITDIYVP